MSLALHRKSTCARLPARWWSLTRGGRRGTLWAASGSMQHPQAICCISIPGNFGAKNSERKNSERNGRTFKRCFLGIGVYLDASFLRIMLGGATFQPGGRIMRGPTGAGPQAHTTWHYLVCWLRGPLARLRGPRLGGRLAGHTRRNIIQACRPPS